VHKNYNGQGSEKELFATSGWQKQEINKAVNPTTSSSETRQERLLGREGPSPWGIAQVEMQKEVCGGETNRNALLKQ